MKRALLLVVVVVGTLVALALLTSGLFVVTETEQVVITQFGKPVGEPITAAGIHWKTPFIQDTHYFDRRFLEWNGLPNQMPTKDKRMIQVDTFARWRIVDPLLFFQRLKNETGAQSRLDDIIDGETRNAVADHDLVEMVRSTNRDVQADPELSPEEQTTRMANIEVGRGGIMTIVLESSRKRTSDLGIEILDVRLKRLNYNDSVQASVFARMVAERERIAERFRSEGQGESARIQGEKAKELQSIQSDAYRQAQEIIGAADAEAASIYAAAYGEDPDFYRFLRTLEAYPDAVDHDTTLVLSTKGEFLQYVQGAGR